MNAGARLFGKARFVKSANLPGRAAQPVVGPHRRALLAKVHLAKKDLALSDDDYRSILLEVAGTNSAAKCSDGDLVAVVERFKSRGWKPAQPKGRSATARAPADHRPAAKARALWISLHHLGAVADPSEAALESFARRQLGCPRLQWADQGMMFRLIEAEKAIAERNGWVQSLEGIAPAMKLIVLKRRLVEAIIAKLRDAGLVPADWDLTRAAWEFAGMKTEFLRASASELDIIARELGKVLRENSGE